MPNYQEADGFVNENIIGTPISSDEQAMSLALKQAQIAYSQQEVPIGAILVKDNKVIAVGYNQCITTQDPSAHAECVAIRAAAKALHNYRLNDTTLYVTLEPCAMCAGLLVHARIKRLVFAATEPKAGAIVSTLNLLERLENNHKIAVSEGVLAEESSALISQFFKQRRAQKKAEKNSANNL